MKNSQELFSYPIVVIESIWPKLPDEAPKLIGEDDKSSKSAYIYSETQNAFSGYFKVIPLNIKNISVNNTKDGHKFDIIFDASYVYVQLDPKRMSKEAYSYIIRNSFEFTQNFSKKKAKEDYRTGERNEQAPNSSIQDFHYLSGILEGHSKSDYESDKFNGLEHYFVPGTVISKFINEMDTVTIFLIQDLSIFSQDELIKLGGGSFSRMREVEKLSGTKTLSELGIVKPLDLTKLPSTSLAEKLQSFRSLITNNGIGRFSTSPNKGNLSFGSEASNNYPTPYSAYNPKINVNTINTETPDLGVGNKNRAYTKAVELALLDAVIEKMKGNKTDSSKNASDQLTKFGFTLYYYLYDILKRDQYAAPTDSVQYIKNLKSSVSNYYTSELSQTVSWSLYKSLSIVLEERTNNKDAIESMIKAAAIDLYISKNYPKTWSQILFDLSSNNVKVARKEDYDFISQQIENIKAVHKTANPSLFKNITAEDYFAGIVAFFTYVIKPLALQDEKDIDSETLYNSKKLSDLVQNSELTLLLNDIASFKYPISCETPYFVLNGHITKISDSSSISDGGAESSISISGSGFELPMQTHNIYFDPYSSEQQFFKTLSQLTIANATPIAAALSLMSAHLPDYPQYFARTNSKQVLKATQDQRNYDLFNKTLGYFVEQGSILRKRPSEKKFFVFSPIHYVDKSYLRIIKNTFDTTLIATQQINTDQRTIGEGPVYNALKSFLSTSSMYSFYVDEFGTIKIRFEPSAVSQTYSTILSPPITDSVIKSIGLTSDSSGLYNMVEVIPKNFSGLGENVLKSGFYGRATPPDVTEVYGLFKEVEFTNELFKSGFYPFLKELLKTFKQTLEYIRLDFNKKSANERGNVTITEPVMLEKPIKYDELFTVFNITREQLGTIKVSKNTDKNTGKKDNNTPKAEAGPPSDICVEEKEPSETKTDDTTSQAVTTTALPAPSKKKMWELIYELMGFENEFEANYKRILSTAEFSSSIEVTSSIPIKLSRMNIPAQFSASPAIPNYAKIKTQLQLFDNTMNYFNDYLTAILLNKINDLSKTNSNPAKILKDITSDSLVTLINLLSTLLRFGIDEKNLETYLVPPSQITNKTTTEKGVDLGIRNYVSWVFRNTKLFYYPQTLNELSNIKGANIPERESRRVPVVDYRVQEMHPENIAPDFFRYGLRNMRQEDYYSSSSVFTEFRAESIRKLHEFPLKTANLTLILNPIYKVGNTVLVVSERAANNKNTYINQGLKATLKDMVEAYRGSYTSTPNQTTTNKATGNLENTLDPKGYNLILRVDDLITEGKEKINLASNDLYTKLTGIKEVNETIIVDHFLHALDFILTTSNKAPVPADAYVPLLGVYTPQKTVSQANVLYRQGERDQGLLVTDRGYILRYLKTLVKFHTASKEYQDKFGSYIQLYEELEDSIINLYKYLFGGAEYDPDKFNHLNNLLKPQNYHVYQYHINTLSHSWSFGRGATTNIGGNFGLPALMTYVPSTNDFDFKQHILGHLVTRGPNFPYNESGTKNKYIRTNNPAYQFSAAQMVTEERFYKSKYRYNLAIILERIRRKYTMPEVYGELLSIREVTGYPTSEKPLNLTPNTGTVKSNLASQTSKKPDKNKSASTTTTTTKKVTSTTTTTTVAKNGSRFPINRISYYSLSPGETDAGNYTAACGPVFCVDSNTTLFAVSTKILNKLKVHSECGKYAELTFTTMSGKTSKIQGVIYDAMGKRYNDTYSIDILIRKNLNIAVANSLKNKTLNNDFDGQAWRSAIDIDQTSALKSGAYMTNPDKGQIKLKDAYLTVFDNKFQTKLDIKIYNDAHVLKKKSKISYSGACVQYPLKG